MRAHDLPADLIASGLEPISERRAERTTKARTTLKRPGRRLFLFVLFFHAVSAHGSGTCLKLTLQYLLPSRYRLYRDACMALEGNYLKDLNVLGRDLSKVAIVDNSPYAYGFQVGAAAAYV